MALFMGLGSLPSFIFMPLVPAIKKKVGKKNMFYIFLSVAIIGMGMLYVISKMGTVKENITLVYIAQFIKSTGVIVATGYMWALIPEVISYAEYTTVRTHPCRTSTGISSSFGTQDWRQHLPTSSRSSLQMKLSATDYPASFRFMIMKQRPCSQRAYGFWLQR